MQSADVVALLRALGCARIRAKANGWVASTCPFATWTHAGAQDSSPSFAIFATDGRSRYRCQGCHRHGDLSALPWALKALGYEKWEKLAEFVRKRNHASLSDLQERGKKASYEAPPKAVNPAGGAKPTLSLEDLLGDPTAKVVIPESDLWHFMKLPEEVLAKRVLAKRKIRPRTYEDWQIRWHPFVGRIAIPTRDYTKQLVGIAGRLGDDDNCFDCDVAYEVIYLPPPLGAPEGTPPKKRFQCPTCLRYRPPKYLHTPGFTRDNYLFGEHRVQRGKKGYLVEGQFDTVGMVQLGYNTLGIMGTWLSRVQIAKVKAWFSEVVLVVEGDKAGLDAEKTMLAALAPHLPTSSVRLPEARDADELEPSEACDILGPPNL